jgi:TonB family protein
MPSRNSVGRAIIAAVAFLCVNIGVANANDTQALRDRLHAAEKDTSLTADDVQPFYLKMSVQLFDPKGAPGEQGTVELYWAGARKEKLVYSFPSYSATEVQVDDKLFRTSGSGVPPAAVPLLIDKVLHPMAQIAQIDKSDPQTRKVTMGKMQLDCIMLARPIGVAPVPLGLFPTYCFDPGDGALRASSIPPFNVILRNVLSTFQQRRIALDVVITAKGVQAVEGKIEKMEQRAIADTDLSTDGLALAPHPPVVIAAGVIAGRVMSAVSPVYPPIAKARHVQGTVVLYAMIGKDGKIHNLEVLSSPDPALTTAAEDAVRQWTYRPYTLLGEPVEVETTINVNFAFGR